ncbi:excinuclease abc subunit a [Lasius niger]|uniref:Excinuclease abc subunit a n=1 Tax=Lasius niger TaxID=67767 RepID=A0A0J7KD04_LASNI|nr:excinuclease abc subunit a [Lasius niger]
MQTHQDKQENVEIFGAKTHNLKDVSLSFPRDAMVMFTGISGSGKSSLAFDTVYAEAQQRYLESVAPHIRHLMRQAAAPDVEKITGLPPAVALQQSRSGAQERSSVGSLTRISTTLRLLFSRSGKYPEDVPFMTAEAFSPNNPQGACPTCLGLGHVHEIKPEMLVPDDTISIRKGAIAAWPHGWQAKNLRAILETLGYDIDAPWHRLSKKDRDWILFTEEQPSVPIFQDLTPQERQKAISAGKKPDYTGTYTSAQKYILQSYAGNKDSVKKRLAPFVAITSCPACHGKKLNKNALSVTFENYNITALNDFTVTALKKRFQPYAEGTSPHLPKENALKEATIRMTADICGRLGQLERLGLGHLSLGRQAGNLSSGELQRIRLATQLISNLFGVMYVLDEPSAGLHPEDVRALLAALRSLLKNGNSLAIVEHNLDLLAQADWLVEVGPKAGEGGGKIIYNGLPSGLEKAAHSCTAPYLFAKKRPALRQRRSPAHWLKLSEISCHNLSNVEVALPLESMSVITGVSGSGKSTLLAHVLPVLLKNFDKTPKEETEEESSIHAEVQGKMIEGGTKLKRLIQINQRPIGRTPRSNLATYTGFFDVVRKLFAATEKAKAKKFDAGRFSFNLPSGRCPACEGQGQISIDLMFLPESTAPCTTCNGTRYNPEPLEIRWKNKNIADILDLTVDEAFHFFEGYDSIERSLSALQVLGLGYLKLGQPATALSGGECQRIKLASELQRQQRGKTLYLLDEPSSGLHPADSDKLIKVLDQLVQRGDTVIMVEHDMRLAAEADWIVDLGPGAGNLGGKIVAAGTPETKYQEIYYSLADPKDYSIFSSNPSSCYHDYDQHHGLQ